MQDNEELTVATIMETSHIVMHSWNEKVPANVQLDVYTWVSLIRICIQLGYNNLILQGMDYKYLDKGFGNLNEYLSTILHKNLYNGGHVNSHKFNTFQIIG